MIIFPSGVVGFYVIVQGTLWWVFNILAIFWKVQFPFHSRYYDKMNRTLYVHIACVVVALLLPIYVPLTLYAKGGFTFARFPPIVCVGRNIDANFYTVIFPTTILYAVGTTMLLLIVWKVRRVSSLALHVSHFEVKCVTL